MLILIYVIDLKNEIYKGTKIGVVLFCPQKFLFWASPARAFGPKGHMVVVKITILVSIYGIAVSRWSRRAQRKPTAQLLDQGISQSKPCQIFSKIIVGTRGQISHIPTICYENQRFWRHLGTKVGLESESCVNTFTEPSARVLDAFPQFGANQSRSSPSICPSRRQHGAFSENEKLLH